MGIHGTIDNCFELYMQSTSEGPVPSLFYRASVKKAEEEVSAALYNVPTLFQRPLSLRLSRLVRH